MYPPPTKILASRAKVAASHETATIVFTGTNGSNAVDDQGHLLKVGGVQLHVFGFGTNHIYATTTDANGVHAYDVTLNADGLGDKPLRTAPGVDLFAGTIIQGTPYVATYNNTDGAFYLQNFYGNPYNVPIGAGMDFWMVMGSGNYRISLRGPTALPQGMAFST